MGILDSVLGLNSSKNTDAQTVNANHLISDSMISNGVTLGNANTTATNAINDFYNRALNSLTGGYGTARSDALNYGDEAQGALSSGVTQATGTLQPFLTSGANANGMLGNALGLNGPNGNAAATAAFTASPGYQWNVDQASDAAARKAASLGISASGNTLDAITRLSSNLANNQYNNWLSGLSGLSTQGQQAANTTAGYQYGGGIGSANLFNNLGTALSGQDTGLASASGNLNLNQGQTLANLATNFGNNLVNSQEWGAGLISGNDIAQGKADDAANNANNGIISGLVGKFFAPLISQASGSVGGLLSGLTGGIL